MATITVIRVQQCLTCPNDRAPGSFYCLTCDPNACQHKLWYSATGSVGLAYLLQKVGNDFFATHRAPAMGESVEVCAGCRMVRYFVSPLGHSMAQLIHSNAQGAKARKEQRDPATGNGYDFWYEDKPDLTDIIEKQYTKGEAL